MSNNVCLCVIVLRQWCWPDIDNPTVAGFSFMRGEKQFLLVTGRSYNLDNNDLMVISWWFHDWQERTQLQPWLSFYDCYHLTGGGSKGLQRWAKVDKGWQRLTKVDKGWQRLTKVNKWWKLPPVQACTLQYQGGLGCSALLSRRQCRRWRSADSKHK